MPLDSTNSLAWSRSAHDHLLSADPQMAACARRYGPLRRELQRDYFSRLVRAIVGQQISGRAAASIYRRLAERSGEPVTPETIEGMSDEAIRACGLSLNKLLAVRDLAHHARTGLLDLDHLETLQDEAVRDQLIAVRGIGRWTADMFLMFSLGRPDVLPTGDMAILEAIRRLYDLPTRPTPKAAEKLADEGRWSPFRTAASMYLWKSLEPDEEVTY